MPATRQIYMLINPNNASAEMDSAEVAPATRKLGLELKILKASTDTEIDAAFATLVEAGGAPLWLSMTPSSWCGASRSPPWRPLTGSMRSTRGANTRRSAAS
jgi:hypothetical protein